MTENAGLYIIVAALWLSAMIQLGRWALRVRLEVIDNKKKMRAEMDAFGDSYRRGVNSRILDEKAAREPDDKGRTTENWMNEGIRCGKLVENIVRQN